MLTTDGPLVINQATDSVMEPGVETEHSLVEAKPRLGKFAVLKRMIQNTKCNILSKINYLLLLVPTQIVRS